MITKYNLYKESLLNKISGLTEEEAWNNVKNDPEKLFSAAQELNKKEWFIRALELEKEKGYKHGFFYSQKDIANILTGFDFSDDEKIELLHLINNPIFMLAVCIRIEFIKGMEIAIKDGADVNMLQSNIFIDIIRSNKLGILKFLIKNGLNKDIIWKLKNLVVHSGHEELKNYLFNYDKKI